MPQVPESIECVWIRPTTPKWLPLGDEISGREPEALQCSFFTLYAAFYTVNFLTHGWALGQCAEGLISSITAWLAGATFWRAGSPARFCHPIDTSRDLADQQATDESSAGQTVSTNRSATRTTGQIA
jgi:hypothetical protein